MGVPAKTDARLCFIAFATKVEWQSQIWISTEILFATKFPDFQFLSSSLLTCHWILKYAKGRKSISGGWTANPSLYRWGHKEVAKSGDLSRLPGGLVPAEQHVDQTSECNAVCPPWHQLQWPPAGQHSRHNVENDLNPADLTSAFVLQKKKKEKEKQRNSITGLLEGGK